MLVKISWNITLNVRSYETVNHPDTARWDGRRVLTNQRLNTTNKMSLPFLYCAINYYNTNIMFFKSCNKTAYHWCYIIHRITTKSVGLKWFDTLTFTDSADHHVTARKRTSADLMLGQRRCQVRWEGDIDQSALEHACQSNLSVSCPYWRWFVIDYIGIKIYLCNTIKSNIIT